MRMAVANMQGKIPRTIMGVIALTCLLGGCRSDEPTGSGSDSLLATPTVFIPTGTLRAPSGIAVDKTGEVWVSDTFADAVRRYTALGSSRLLLPGITQPGKMGFDRSTNNILVVSNSTLVYQIDPASNVATILTQVSTGTLDTSSVFNLATGATGSRSAQVPVLGDLDGTPSGDIFVSMVAGSAENFLVRIRNGQSAAIAFSPVRPLVAFDISARFLSVDRFGTVFTSFVTDASQSATEITAFGVFPSNLGATAPLPASGITARAIGSGIDDAGILFVADASARQILILSSSSGQTLERVDMPEIAGMTQPSPRDVAAGPDGSVFVACSDLFDTGNTLGAVLKFARIRQ
jgi:hypothetical protein